jgi:cell division septation protein DedD
MGETFIITVLSFVLVLALIASLLVWVILSAIKDDDEDEEDKKDRKVKQLALSDYIDDINEINKSAYDFDQEQQEDIEANTENISLMQEDLDSVAGLAAISLMGEEGVSTSNAATAQFDNGIWTISQGDTTFKSTPTEVFVDGVCSPWSSSTGAPATSTPTTTSSAPITTSTPTTTTSTPTTTTPTTTTATATTPTTTTRMSTTPTILPITPTVWEFYVSVPSVHSKNFARSGSTSSFGGEAIFADSWRAYKDTRWYTEDNEPGSLLFTFEDETNSVSPEFTIIWHRSKHTPGVQIRRDGIPVCTDTKNKGKSYYPGHNPIKYKISGS